PASNHNLPQHYATHHNPSRQAESEILRFFPTLRRAQNSRTPAARVADMLKSDTGRTYPVDLVDAALRADPTTFARMEPEALRLVHQAMGRVISDDSDDLPRARRALAAALSGVGGNDPASWEARRILTALLPAALRPNRIFDARTTQAELPRQA